MTVGIMEQHAFVEGAQPTVCIQVLGKPDGPAEEHFICGRGRFHELHRVRNIDGSPLIEGIGPDAPKVTGAHGGQQSELTYRFDLIDAKALFALAKILDYGTRVRGYPEENWRLIPARENVNHALMHIYAWLANDFQDEHLEHAFTRLMFALGVELAGGVPVK